MMSYNAPLLSALLLTTSMLTAAPEPANTMTQAKITTETIGKDLVGQRTGKTKRLHYDTSGNITMKAAFVTSAGTWTFAGDGLFMTMTKGPKRGKTCTTLERPGGGAFRNSEEVVRRISK